ncbi:CopD family protein [Sulfuriferula nivalis]|uniref:Protoporphyrinogen IX oxidase n=1 Tax=Sulfuriferula nivalis TaxID=2675298 RepID=A0A809RM63_9PROT|nr:CopD family protein [Sulfuriferula nivalis]BBP01884.1 membrane protein [Sulfuriferula nivalis]
MLWIKALHIIFVASWFAGLFYLPRLFVNHAMVNDAATIAQFKLMERKLYKFMTPLGVLALIFGTWLWLRYGYSGAWLDIKLALVGVLIAYHLYCGHLVQVFARDENKRSHVFYRWFNELPVLILFVVVFLVVLKPEFA